MWLEILGDSRLGRKKGKVKSSKIKTVENVGNPFGSAQDKFLLVLQCV